MPKRFKYEVLMAGITKGPKWDPPLVGGRGHLFRYTQKNTITSRYQDNPSLNLYNKGSDLGASDESSDTSDDAGNSFPDLNLDLSRTGCVSLPRGTRQVLNLVGSRYLLYCL